MTSPTLPGSDLDTIVSRTRHLLLDFDGPICSIFAGLPAATIADRLCKIFGDHAQLPDDVARTADPFEVFAYAATISEDLAARVEAEMTDQELVAVPTAAPTPYIHEVVTACQNSGRSVAVVSNNSARGPSTPTSPATAWTTGSASSSRGQTTTPRSSNPARI